MLNSIPKSAEQKFGEEVSDLFHPRNPKGVSLRRFIQIYTQRWHLNPSDSEDVMSEAILQGLRHTRKTGEEIRCPEAWLRVAMMSILRNRMRKTMLQGKLSEELKQVHPTNSDDPALQLELRDSLNQLDIARQTLSAEDQELLTLYFDQDKTYEQIRAYYERKNGESVNLSTIRKRVSRARERAIKAFHKTVKLTL
jgi:RNA polymerase sigma factor (sigma-70 family)